MRSIPSFDLHLSDRPQDLEASIEYLASAGVKASFFIPGSVIASPPHRTHLRELARQGHELGTHSHRHNDEEMVALRGGERHNLDFLSRCTDEFADFFGFMPRIFRSPCWAYIGDRASDKLADLGYRVDSSSTPQRPGVLSYFPTEHRHLLARRDPHFLPSGLLEVPTSTFLVPLAWPTFCAFRETGTMWFVRMLMLEASIRKPVVIVPQFHVSDFSPDGGPVRHDRRCWRDLIPKTVGGIRARRWFRLADRGRLVVLCKRVMSVLSENGMTTFQSVYCEMSREPAKARLELKEGHSGGSV